MQQCLVEILNPITNLPFLKNISNQSDSDRDLVLLYKRSGDLKFLAALYQRYMELVFGVCLKYLRESETAKDAVMAIFEELVLKLQKHEVENFRSWLYSLSKNYCLMQLRSAKHLPTKEIDVHMQLTEDVHLNGVMEKEEHYEKLSKCMETLPSEQKKVIELFYLQDKCYKDISAITKLDWDKVRSLIQNGRRNLKICMDEKWITKNKV